MYLAVGFGGFQRSAQKQVELGHVIVGLVVGLVLAAAGSSSAEGTPRAPGDVASRRATLEKFCISCHNQRLKTAGLALDRLDPDNVSTDAESWEKVVRKLRLGVMPPVGAPRPDRATYDGLIDGLEQALDSSARRTAGRPLLHRLNRTEYDNAIRDLLGLDVDVASLLPPDDAAFGFDNVADALGSSPALMQAYLAAARKISAVAVGSATIDPSSETYSVRQDLSQDHHLEGLPLGTIGGMSARHAFPLDGEYEFQVRLFRTNLSAIRGLEDRHQVELTLDGKRILLAEFGGDEDLVAVQRNPTDASDRLEATRFRVRFFVNAGLRDVGAAFIDETPVLLKTNRLQRFVRDFNPFDAEGAPHVQSITVTGPFNAAGSGNGSPFRVFSCWPDGSRAELPCARRIVATIARRAYRRPVPPQEVEDLLSFYRQGRADGSFTSGVELVLRRILASPSFVFRPEREPAGLAPGTPYRITDFELASRLSFFLWSSIPDDELLRLAGEGRLSQPDVQSQQVRRMLADPRSEALITNFAGQWLQLRNLRGIVPNSDLFPDFDDNLRQAFRREAELFFGSIVREDRNVLDLLTADYTFVNERLAKHYGMPGVFGSRFRRVSALDDARRGLLGKGAVLLVTSHANTTSPVLRGKWVLDNILGAPPPPPPPDVPALKELEPGAAPRTMREQMELHRTNPTCAACHKRMDPIGFALENFDTVGAWRTTEDSGAPLDTSDVLANGTRIDGVSQLRQVLLDRPTVFVQTLVEKLMIYALGRGLTSDDMPAVRKIVRGAQSQNLRFSSLVSGIVSSVPFQMRDAQQGRDSREVAAVQ
jgi:hypothetical protein